MSAKWHPFCPGEDELSLSMIRNVCLNRYLVEIPYTDQLITSEYISEKSELIKLFWGQNQYRIRRLIVKSRKFSTIGYQNACIALKFGRRIGGSTTETPVQFQSNWKTLTPTRAFETLRDLLIRRPKQFWMDP